MQPDDRYRSRLELTTATLTGWSGFVRDVATVTFDDADTFWSMAVVPRTVDCCGMALVLDRQHQTFSLTLDDEHYADLPVHDLDVFPEIAEAVAAGQVVQRRHYLRSTGLALAVEMRVGRADAPLFAKTRSLSTIAIPADDAAFIDRHYLPYRR